MKSKLRFKLVVVLSAFLLLVGCQNAITGLTFVEGNESNATTVGISDFSVEINGSALNESHNYTGVLPVQFFDNGTLLANFSFDFDNDVLNLSNVSVERGNGVAVNGVFASKTFFIERNGATSVCAQNADNISLSDINPACAGPDDTALICDNVAVNGIACKANATTFAVSGLSHSGVKPLTLDVINTSLTSLGQGANTTITVTGTGFVPGSTITTTSPDVSILSQSFVNGTALSMYVYVDLNASLENATFTVTNPDGNATDFNITIVFGPFLMKDVHVYYHPNITNQTIYYNASVWAAPGVDVFTLNLSNTFFVLKNSTLNPVNVSMEFLNYSITYHHGSPLWGIYVNGSAVVPISGYWNESELVTTVNQSAPCVDNCSVEWLGFASDTVYNGAPPLLLSCPADLDLTVGEAATREFILDDGGVPPTLPLVPTLLTPPGVPGMAYEANMAGDAVELTGTPTTEGDFTDTYAVADSGVRSGPPVDCTFSVSAAAGGGGGGGGGGGSRFYEYQDFVYQYPEYCADPANAGRIACRGYQPEEQVPVEPLPEEIIPEVPESNGVEEPEVPEMNGAGGVGPGIGPGVGPGLGAADGTTSTESGPGDAATVSPSETAEETQQAMRTSFFSIAALALVALVLAAAIALRRHWAAEAKPKRGRRK